LSSILKALKKVETAGYQGKGAGEYPYRPQPEPGPRRQVNYLWVLNVGILVLCLAIVVLVFTRIPLFQKPGKSPGASSKSVPTAFDIELVEPLKKKAQALKDAPSTTTPPVKAMPAAVSTKQEPTPVQEGQPPPEPATAEATVSSEPGETTTVQYLDSSRFRLEGVVVVESSNTRYAIINNSIVRKGSRVRGHKVIHIQNDYVELEGPDGSSLFRLEAP